MNIGQKYRRTIKVLCPLLGYSRQSYYQGIKALQKEALDAKIIIQQVIKHSKHNQK